MLSTPDLPTRLLSQAGQRAQRILAERLADAGARDYQYRILEVLATETPLSQVVIGSLARLDRSDVAVTLAELEESGFVVRSPDPKDARRNVVEATLAGRARLEVLAAVVAAAQDEVLAPLDDELRPVFLRALRKLQPDA